MDQKGKGRHSGVETGMVVGDKGMVTAKGKVYTDMNMHTYIDVRSMNGPPINGGG